MPAPDPHSGPDMDILADTFLHAPLPNLPRRCRLFQRDDIDQERAKASYQQFVDRYHGVAGAIDSGFGPDAILSPSAWVKMTSDLVECFIHSIRASRPADPPKDSTSLDAFQAHFREEDWETIKQLRVNLNHLTKVFPDSSPEPPLICGHCAHRTDPDAMDRLTEADYRCILTATDRSRTAVMGVIRENMTEAMFKETQKWARDEDARRKNELRVQLRQDAENFYTARMLQTQKVEEKRAEVDCREYYGKCFFKLTKNTDAQIKKDIATY
jgi:hypothetical protein